MLFKDLAEGVRNALDSEAPDEEDSRVFLVVHLLAQVAVSLIEGIRQLLPSNTYAANTLIRQLVEVEYLAWACGHDPAEAVDWLTSDRETRLKRWSPQRLRSRAEGRFDDQDYWNHCETGGHPTPGGIMALHGPTEANPELVVMPEVALYEAALHATAIADYLSHAVPTRLPVATDALRRAHTTNLTWRTDDPAASWRKGAVMDSEAQARAMLDIAIELFDSATPE